MREGDLVGAQTSDRTDVNKKNIIVKVFCKFGLVEKNLVYQGHLSEVCDLVL